MLLRVCIGIFVCASALSAQAGRGGRGGAVSGQPGGAPPPPSDCAASGTVVNGLTGELIPRAMVTIVGGVAGEVSGTASDATGHWSVTNVSCGMRTPGATHAGFIIPSQPGARQAIQLVSGSPVANVKIQLVPASIVTGTVRDGDGDPVDGALIRLVMVRVISGKRTIVSGANASTDSDGNFRLGNLEAGRYVVCAESRRPAYPPGGGEPLIYREACYPGPAEAAMSVSLRLEAGREFRTSFTLTPVSGVHIRGRVATIPEAPKTNGPVPAVQVTRISNNASFGMSTRVLPDGSFTTGPVLPGTYVLRQVINQGQAGPPSIAMAQVEVENSDIDNVVLRLQTGGTVSGAVRYELSSVGTGAAVNASPSMFVGMAPAAPGTSFIGPAPQVKWDAGHVTFTLDGVMPGLYRLNVNAGTSLLYVKSATLHGQDVLNQPFQAEGTAGPIDIVVSDDMGGLDALVNDTDGHPVAAGVLLVAGDGRTRVLAAASDGHATQKNVPTGEYKAWAFADINSVPYAEPEWMTRNAGPGEKVTVTTGGTASVTLKKTIDPAE